jgi:dipeptidyl aminopeptidase/acylaminoacyl peptidase
MLLTGCSQTPTLKLTLIEAKKNYQTQLLKKVAMGYPVTPPPLDRLQVVHYSSSVGSLPAYVSKPAEAGKKYPAIIWLAGGFSNSIGEIAWTELPKENDQSATIFRKYDIVTMYPSLRGGNENPGSVENCFGEVDDVISAAQFLAQQPYVDPKRIYLGGHSTGGTLALLVAESSDLFRTVFSLGPVEDVTGYDSKYLNFDVQNAMESKLRAPIHWLHGIKNPTFVFEGTEGGNIASLQAMAEANRNDLVHFFPLQSCNHYQGIAPVSSLIANKILHDTESKSNITFDSNELAAKIKAY